MSTVEGVGATAETLAATLEQMKVVEDVRRRSATSRMEGHRRRSTGQLMSFDPTSFFLSLFPSGRTGAVHVRKKQQRGHG